MPRHRTSASQQGFTIIEALMAMLIFAVGLLGIAGLYGTAVRQVTGSEFRTTAAMLANDLIGRMWMSDRSYAALQASYDSTVAGAGYTSWQAAVAKSGLPGVADLPPIVTFALPVAGGGTTPVSSSLVTVTVRWKGPGDETSHSYVALAQMKP